ncbi:HNH endonuclease [Emcibacter nanhaiensis]|uniref:HNH endonuclease n=1 Tax=Emcibacter nanhaiensis TaxID=1505037 RepID=A0A501PG88_9PROT|nr:HNH endonuclease [Emcibacter nanhaiensis]TPD59205.1 HNH endonuclease [Emcibacter nanhaiensis]
MTEDSADICLLCHRPLGRRVEKHHLVPKSLGGREVVLLHAICHRKIHSLYSERELKHNFHSIEKLRDEAEIRSFCQWLRGKPADFYKRTEQNRRGK